MPQAISSKQCNSCNEELPINDFYKYIVRGNVYYQNKCKTCSKKSRNELNRARGAAQQMTEIERLDEKTLERLNRDLKKPLMTRAQVSRKYNLPYNSVVYYFNSRVKPLIESENESDSESESDSENQSESEEVNENSGDE